MSANFLERIQRIEMLKIGVISKVMNNKSMSMRDYKGLRIRLFHYYHHYWKKS